jgi:hypothetical protein
VTAPALPASHAIAPNEVAVVGDTEAALDANIRAARSAKLDPHYIVVSAKSRDYEFSVYHRVLRSKRALIVRAYKRIFVFPISAVKLRYYPSGNAIRAADIPRLDDGVFDIAVQRYMRLTQHGRASQVFRPTNRAKKQAICADCASVLISPRKIMHFGKAWSSYSTPWQASPDYVFWRPGTRSGVQIASNEEENAGSSGSSGSSGSVGSSESGGSSGGFSDCSSFSSGSGFSGGSGASGGSSGFSGEDATNSHKRSAQGQRRVMDAGGCGTQVAIACSKAPRPNNGSVNGKSDHNDLISNTREVWFGGQFFGWEYQTYGGAEYFQPDNTFSVSAGVISVSSGSGPIVPWGGSLANALKNIGNSIGATGNPSFPGKWGTVKSNSGVTTVKCPPGSTA